MGAKLTELLGPTDPMVHPRSASQVPEARYRLSGSGSCRAIGHSAKASSRKKTKCRANPTRPPST